MFAQVRVWLARLGLQWRIQLLLMVGLLSLFILFWLAGQRAIAESTRQSFDYQLTTARFIARTLDHRLDTALALLESTAARPDLNPSSPTGLCPLFLRDAQLQLSAYGQRLFWLDAKGAILCAEPPPSPPLPASFPYFSAVRLALETGKRHISNLCQGGDAGSPYIFLAVPAPAGSEHPSTLLVEAIQANRLGLTEILEQVAPDGNASIEVIDHQGMVLASSTPGRCFGQADHGGQFVALIDSHKPLVQRCHHCHTAAGSQPIVRGDEVLAFAPLTVVAWGVAIRQPAETVMAPVNHLRYEILLGGAAVLATAMLGASWFVRRQIVGPLRALSEVSSQFAVGNLDVPVRHEGGGEVARLTVSLERMRRRLEAILEDHRRWNEVLEELVEERTRELTLLYEQLESKAAVCKQLLGKVLTAQEEERTRLARELHDAVGQSLTAIIMATASVEKSLPPELERGRKKLERVRDIAAQALHDLRTLIADLRPETLDDLGLVLALRSQAREHLESLGIQVQFKVDGLSERLPSEVETVIFRVVQEAITNIARHARATEAAISLSRRNTRLIVRVEDNGIGFPMEGVQSGRTPAWGLRGMEERITLLGGKFLIQSRPGDGTLILAEVPLPEEREPAKEAPCAKSAS